MKNLLVAAALSALCASAAMAQDHHDRGPGNGGGPGEHHNAAPAAPRPAPQPQAMHRGEPNRPANNNAGDRHDRPGRDTNNRPDNNRPAFNPPRPDNNRPAFNPPNNRPGPNRPAANNAPRRDFSSYHRNFTAPRRYHAPTYRRPPGFYVHRWTFGERLPAAFWARDYWLTDFVDFGLMPPPPGTTWVRYGSDALLIDEYSGEVIQVEYNVFY